METLLPYPRTGLAGGGLGGEIDVILDGMGLAGVGAPFLEEFEDMPVQVHESAPGAGEQASAAPEIIIMGLPYPETASSLQKGRPLATPKSSDRSQVVDLVRTVCVMTVMSLHLKPTLFLSKEPWFCFAWDRFQRNGALGVLLFFTVSGYLITRILRSRSKSLFKPNFRVFYSQRVGRIFPLYFLVVALGTLILLTVQDPSKKFNYCFGSVRQMLDPLFWLSLFSFTFNWFQILVSKVPIALYFGVLWSLSVEEQFYILYPFLLSKLKKDVHLLRFSLFLVAFGFSWRLAIYLFGRADFGAQLHLTLGVVDQIGFGILLYCLGARWDPWLSQNRGVGGLLCLGGFLLMVGIYFGTFIVEAGDRVYAPTFLGLGLVLFLLGGRHLDFFESRFLTWLSWPGKYCYGCYLLNIAVLYCTHPLLVKLHTFFAFVLFVSLTTALAAFSFHFFELPANLWLRRQLAPASVKK